MRNLLNLRLSAPSRGRPPRPRSRPRVRAAIAVTALSIVTLVSGNAVAYAAADAPYGGTAAAVPGTVQAENYDTGGQGVAYNVTAVNGSGNSYRSDGVDLEATTDTGGGYDLGWTGAGQWFKYTVNAATAGTYTLSLRLAAPTAVTDGLHIANAAGTNLSGNVNVPATGGYQTWTTVNTTVTLTAGTQTLTVDQDSAGWNLNYFTFASSQGPYGGTAAAVPGTVQAENYDTGGQGTAYSVTAVNGSGNSYRPDGVDLEATSDTGGGSDLGWTGAGQWFKYTVNAAAAGNYTVSLRIAAPAAVTDALHIANSAGTNLSGNVNAPATGGYQTWSTVTATVALVAGTQTLTVDQDNAGWNLNYLTFAQSGGGGGTPPPPTGGSLGSNVIVFTPTEPEATIQSQLNSLGTQQNPNQFGTQRYELLFEPGTYGTSASPLDFQVGYYEAVAGLGQNPSQTVINGTIDSYNQCPGGVQTNCNATDNFWRSVTNLTINVAGLTGCFAGDEVWASSQDSPLRRVDINGNTTLMDFCDGSPDYASGGFIGDSDLNGTVTNGSQQQYFTQDTTIGSWSNAVWNQVFCGDPGAPAQSFAANSGDTGGPNSYTTLASCPVSEQEPYLYQDSSGNYNVFVPSVQTNSSGPSWANGNTPGTSLSVNNTFYIVNASSTITQINAATAAGDNLLFTPGVYSYASPINVTKADTKVIGLGFATLIPTNGNVALNVADVPGVNVSGLIFDAGPVNSPVLLQVGTAGSTANNASDPVTVDDVSFRIGGAEAGSATTSFVDDSNNSIIDDVWAWRADHGTGVGWTANTGANGLIVNGNNVSAYGLAVEHYQGYEVEWNGQNGEVLFFQNENPYDVPSQSAWMSSATQDGYPAIYVPNSVSSFTGYGLGSYSYFSQGVPIENAEAFQVPTSSGIQLHDLLTVFLNGSGGIQSVVNGTGTAVSSTNIGPSDVLSSN
jgi:Carbohydrate binding module (family 6)